MDKTFNWMPILRTGSFVDKSNQKVSIDEAKIDSIIAATDLNKEPQFVIEHPKFDKIGFGTIGKLKRVGQYLFALPKEVNEKFKTIVNSGDLPGRSVTLDKNSFALNNISFLPPEIEPAVSGLGNYSFSRNADDRLSLQLFLPGAESHSAEIESATGEDKFEFQQFEVSSYPFRSIQTLFRNVKNFLIENFSLDDAEKVLPEYSLSDLGNPPSIYETPDDSPATNVNPSFSTNNNGDKMPTIDLSKYDFSKVDVNLKTAIQELLGENQTLTTNLDAKNVELQTASQKLTAAETAKLRNEVLQFCESDEVKLKIKPADKEKTIQFLIAQKGKGVIEFSAPDNTKVQLDAFEFAKEQIKNSPDVVELSELATNAKAVNADTPDYLSTAKQMADVVSNRR